MVVKVKRLKNEKANNDVPLCFALFAATGFEVSV